jgi:hypothetical protein
MLDDTGSVGGTRSTATRDYELVSVNGKSNSDTASVSGLSMSLSTTPRAPSKKPFLEMLLDTKADPRAKPLGSLMWSRACVYIGSFCVLAAAIISSLPDYIGSANLDAILPHCAPQFDLMVRTIFRMIIGTLASAVTIAQMFGIVVSLYARVNVYMCVYVWVGDLVLLPIFLPSATSFFFSFFFSFSGSFSTLRKS